MMKAFCPGHITCFFSPAGAPEDNILARGSCGAGIRTSLGSTVELVESQRSRSRIFMDGSEVDAPVSESVLRQLSGGKCYEVHVENELPCGEGFGMSASGSIALALCLSEISGDSQQKAYECAHSAEIEGGGGLGDVSALTCLEHQPVRVRHGLPPIGKVIGTGVRFDSISIAVLGPKMNTGSVLSEKSVYDRIVEAGADAISRYISDPRKESLYSLSNAFSKSAGVESPSVARAIHSLNENGYGAAMCMLGNSIFSDAPADVMEDVLGENVPVFVCSSTDEPARLIRKE